MNCLLIYFFTQIHHLPFFSVMRHVCFFRSILWAPSFFCSTKSWHRTTFVWVSTLEPCPRHTSTLRKLIRTRTTSIDEKCFFYRFSLQSKSPLLLYRSRCGDSKWDQRCKKKGVRFSLFFKSLRIILLALTPIP